MAEKGLTFSLHKNQCTAEEKNGRFARNCKRKMHEISGKQLVRACLLFLQKKIVDEWNLGRDLGKETRMKAMNIPFGTETRYEPLVATIYNEREKTIIKINYRRQEKKQKDKDGKGKTNHPRKMKKPALGTYLAVQSNQARSP